jgi:hypothetical protein
MNHTLFAAFLTCVLFLLVFFFFALGKYLGALKLRKDPNAVQGAGSLEAAVFGLLGLLLAFTFSGAASRYEARHHLVTEEANAIGTAYLRIDLLENAGQAAAELRTLFRSYLLTRIETYQDIENVALTKAKFAKSAALQAEIWRKALAACQHPSIPPIATTLLVPALNQMFDIVTTRVMASRNHPPRVIYLLLMILCLVSVLLSGYAMGGDKSRGIPYIIAFALTVSFTLYLILDLEYPRRGLIRVEDADQVLVELLASIKP